MASKDCLREIYRRKRGTLSDEERAIGNTCFPANKTPS